MRRLLIMAAVVFSACNTSDSADSNKKNSENTKEVYKAMETGDVSKLDQFIDKDVIDHSDTGDIKGLENVKKMFVTINKQMKDLKFDLISDATTSNGEYHFSYYKMSGTCNDPSMGMPPGTKMNMSGVNVVRIKDGKAVEHWAFGDPKVMMEMMSKMQEPPKMMGPGSDSSK